MRRLTSAPRPPGTPPLRIVDVGAGAGPIAVSLAVALRERLLLRASLLTPNVPEAELLLGHAIGDAAAAEGALVELLALGPRAVLLKGGHLRGKEVVDRYDDGEVFAELVHPRLRLAGHGTGCTLAAAIAANLCRGQPLPRACAEATDYLHGALAAAYRPGTAPLAVLDHVWEVRRPGPSGIGRGKRLG
jgi:hydroxymethylpyrimidine/phosphomethylpyrimidine kinase